MSEAPNAPASWDSQGCGVCRRQWETAERPVFVAANAVDHSELYRCAVCGALWLMTERAAFVVQPEGIRSTYPGVIESAEGHPPSDGVHPDAAPAAASAAAPSRSDAPASDVGVQYWRHSVASEDRFFRLANGRDFILRGDQWVPYHGYKSGPSWWRLTGEPGADVVTGHDLPPDAPGWVPER